MSFRQPIRSHTSCLPSSVSDLPGFMPLLATDLLVGFGMSQTCSHLRSLALAILSGQNALVSRYLPSLHPYHLQIFSQMCPYQFSLDHRFFKIANILLFCIHYRSSLIYFTLSFITNCYIFFTSLLSASPSPLDFCPFCSLKYPL